MCVSVFVFVCVFVFVLSPLLFASRGVRLRALSSECKIDQVDFADWMSFLQSDSMEEISPNPEARSADT